MNWKKELLRNNEAAKNQKNTLKMIFHFYSASVSLLPEMLFSLNFDFVLKMFIKVVSYWAVAAFMRESPEFSLHEFQRCKFL